MDVIVVGGGVIGLLCARELRLRGLTVTLVDRDRPGKQASWASAGILSMVSKSEGSSHGLLLRRSAAIYPRLVEGLREESGVDPEMTLDGQLIPAFSDDDAQVLQEYCDAERRDGLDCKMVSHQELRELEPAIGSSVIAAELRPGGQIDNRRLCRALEIADRRAGVRMEFGSPVVEVLRDGDRVRGVRTLQGDLHAERVVIAAGSWSGQIRGCDPVPPVVPQRGEILALDQSAIGLKRVISKPNDPYLVPRADGRLVIGATRKYVGYDATFTAGGIAWLLNEAMAMVPALEAAPIVETWTGFRPVSVDGLPIIGPSMVEGLFYATGHGPSGIAPAPASAELLADVMLGQRPKLPPEPLDPRRFAGRQIDLDPSGWGERGGTSHESLLRLERGSPPH